MTLERAAEILDLTHREHYESIDPVNEACEIGRKAILKQIPQKVIFASRSNDESVHRNDIAECPNCESVFLRHRSNYLKSLNWGCEYCPDCGQALDWSKNDE